MVERSSQTLFRRSIFEGLDFEGKHNWVRGAFDGGKMRNDYTAADIYRVQTIQAIMGIDVTGFYDAKTHYAAAQLQLMYNIQNSKSGVFGTNTLLAAEALWSKDWKFEEFYMGIFDRQVGHFIVDTTLDLAISFGISKIGSLASTSNVVNNSASVGGLKIARSSGLGTLRPQSIQTPYGSAYQSISLDAIAMRNQVLNGATLYKGGALGVSTTNDAQFWALESPLSKGYANRYGVASFTQP